MERLLSDVEPDHREIQAALEDPTCRLGIDPDVERCCRGDVALPDRAADHHDPLEPTRELRVTREEQRDVRKRSGGDQCQRPRASAHAVSDPVDRVPAFSFARGRRQVRSIEPALAVHLGGDSELADERPAGAGHHRDVRPADVIKHPDRVGRGLLKRLVARDRGHAEQLELTACEREQQRDRVVVPGVAIEDDFGHPTTASSSAAVGNEGCAPRRDAASAPAAHARTSAAARSLPSSSPTISAAQNASPAAVPSTTFTRGGRARATSLPPSSKSAPSAPSVSATNPPYGPTTSYS